MSFAIIPAADRHLCEKKQRTFKGDNEQTMQQNSFILREVLRNNTSKNGLSKKFDLI